MLTGVLHRQNKTTPTTHRVVNLSATGLRMSAVEGLKIGEMVAVTIGLVESVLARVVRVDEASVALAFVEPIDVVEARKRRRDTGAIVPRTGWLAEMQDAYGKQ
ncbi:PilZ domain-containing protein [Roseomonas aeriglobus]|nr:PilZ domain-containing protein [Roseomonas aeriglobus]